jgi:putative pyruvate formate lyase activating enzyme
MEDCSRGHFVLMTLATPSAAAAREVLSRAEWTPAYQKLGEAEVGRRAATLRKIMEACHLCPRVCGVNRLRGQKGVCRSSARARVASWHPHLGEERPLVGRHGSGTIFFSHCNLLCEFCQNWEINHLGHGDDCTDEQVAGMMIALQEKGCHNVNLVTPTHQLPMIVNAVRIAMRKGLRVPLVYNCGGYEGLEAVQMLDGIVDIYLPDFKYMDGAVAAKISRGARDYPEVCAAAIQEMHRQVGPLVVDENGIALRGLMIRHLVLPGDLAKSQKFVQWVAQTLGANTYVNIMAQYRPMHRARFYPEIDRRTTRAEHQSAVRWAREAGLLQIDGA